MGNGFERKESDVLRLSVLKNLEIFLLEVVHNFAASIGDHGPHLNQSGIDLDNVFAGLPGRFLS